MKKIAMFLLGVAAVMSLSACTPTTEKQKQAPETTQETVAEKVPDSNAIPMEVMSVYFANEEATGLEKTMDAVEGEELTAQAVVDKLIEFGILDEGTTVISFDIKENVGTLDLSQVPSSGTTGETLMLTALGNTFIENYELEQLKLLVNGENYSSGHIEHGDEDYLTYVKEYKEIK